MPSRLPLATACPARQARLLAALGCEEDVGTVRHVPRFLRLRCGCTAEDVDRCLALRGYPPSRPTLLEDFVALEPDVPVTALGCHGPRLAIGLDLASGVVVRELLRGECPCVALCRTLTRDVWQCQLAECLVSVCVSVCRSSVPSSPV